MFFFSLASSPWTAGATDTRTLQGPRTSTFQTHWPSHDNLQANNNKLLIGPTQVDLESSVSILTHARPNHVHDACAGLYCTYNVGLRDVIRGGKGVISPPLIWKIVTFCVFAQLFFVLFICCFSPPLGSRSKYCPPPGKKEMTSLVDLHVDHYYSLSFGHPQPMSI